jgi:hypothetical protein
MNADAPLWRALLRQYFNAFVEKTFATLASGQAFVAGWHLRAIGWQRERVRRGEIGRLIVDPPPRSLKSIMASVDLQAFPLGHDPARRIIRVSYWGDLARKHANDFRGLMEAPWCRELFPGARLCEPAWRLTPNQRPKRTLRCNAFQMFQFPTMDAVNVGRRSGSIEAETLEGSDWLVNGAFCSDTAVLARRSIRRSRRERNKARRRACRRSGHSRSIFAAPPHFGQVDISRGWGGR